MSSPLSELEQKQFEQIDKYVKERLSAESTGHDYYHAKRVADLGMKIALAEGGDLFIAATAGLMHDLFGRKKKPIK